MWVRYLRSLRLWFGVLAALVGVAIGVLTNIVTSTPTWPVIVGLVAAVAILLGLTVWQASRDEQSRLKKLRAARARVLRPLQPEMPGTHRISTLLAAEHALAPFRARLTETQALTHWCTDAAAPVVHVVAGPGGVGKSRLAVEVARLLPDEWVTGRCVGGRAGDVLPPVLACQEPTLVVVDDADTEPGVASLIEELGEQEGRGQVKVLLLVRDAEVFEQWVQQQLPDRHRGHLPTMPLAVVGEAGDRRRWFVEAARAYATALNIPPPPVSDMDTRPVGTDGEAMVVTQARAALAALAATRDRADSIRTAGIDRVAAELIEHERQRWNRAATDPRWGLPESFTVEARQEALLALALLAPATPAEVAGVLRQLPRFRDGTDEGLLRNVLAWAHHLYPGPGPAQVEPSPNFLRGVLLTALRSPAQAELTDSLLSALSRPQCTEVLTRIIRAAALFGTVAPLVGKVVQAQPSVLGGAIESLVLAGPAAWSAERHLLVAITPSVFSADEIRRLLDLLRPTQLHHLRAALQECAVQHARDAQDKDDTEETRAALGLALNNLGPSLGEMGRYPEALTVSEEAVSLWRGLVARQPARHTPDLARALRGLGSTLAEVGRYPEALTKYEEAVCLWRGLAARQPTRHTPDLARSLYGLGAGLREVGRYPEALAKFEEAVTLWRGVTVQQPARHTPSLAIALNNLGAGLQEVGRYPEAVTVFEEAVNLWRGLTTQQPARHTPTLVLSLNNLALTLCQLDRHDEELELRTEATVHWRMLAQLHPDGHEDTYQHARDRLAGNYSKHGHEPNAAWQAEENLAHRLGLVTTPPKPQCTAERRG